LQIRIDFLLRHLERLDIPQDAKERINSVILGIKPDVQKFTKLIDTLLDVSRFRGHKMALIFEKVNISQVVADEVFRIQNQFEEKGVTLGHDIQFDIFGKIDSLRIQQVVAN